MESARLDSQFPSGINLEPQHAGVIKRIRQACSNCRYVTLSRCPSISTCDIPSVIHPLMPGTSPRGFAHSPASQHELDGNLNYAL